MDSSPRMPRLMLSPRTRSTGDLPSPSSPRWGWSARRCKICHEQIDSTTPRDGHRHHRGCHPCDVCKREVTGRRLIRLHVLVEGNPDEGKFLPAPYDCECLLGFDGTTRQKLATQGIENTLASMEWDNEELFAFLMHSFPYVNHADALDIIRTAVVASKGYTTE